MNGQRIQQLLRTLGTLVALRLWPALRALVLQRVWPLLRPLVVQRIWPAVRGHSVALWNRLPLAVRKVCLVTWWRTRSALHILATLVMIGLERLRKRLGSEEDGTVPSRSLLGVIIIAALLVGVLGALAATSGGSQPSTSTGAATVSTPAAVLTPAVATATPPVGPAATAAPSAPLPANAATACAGSGYNANNNPDGAAQQTAVAEGTPPAVVYNCSSN